jgi:putative aminopeptidase FrvX
VSPRASHLDSLLPALSEAFGPPGREGGIRAAIKRALRGLGTVREDALGNVHLHVPGKGPRFLLTAHMDAPGVIVTRVDGSGLARLSILGPMAAADWVGASVTLDGSTRREGGAHGDAETRGVVGWDRPKDAKDSREIEADALFLETGLGTKKASKRIEVGAVGALEDRAERLGDLWCGGNLDNRAGCAAVLAAVKGTRGIRNDLHVVFSAQSDLGARGAGTSAFGIGPDAAVVLDVAFVGESKAPGDIALGKGPCLGLKEEGYLPHPEALGFVKRAARSARVAHQWLIRESSGSDARAVRASRSGVPTALVAIPARKTGGPRVLMHASDLEQTVKLLRGILTTPYTGEKGSR